MKPVPHVCKTCALAVWQRGDGGRILSARGGKCGFKLPDPDLLPIVCDPPVPQTKPSVWRDDARVCPVWEPLP